MSRFINDCETIVKTSTVSPVQLIIDVTNSTRDPANSGVIRVTRRFSRELQKTTDPLFVVWFGATGYVLPTREEHAQLSQFNGPLPSGERRLSPDAVHRVKLEEILPTLSAHEPCLLLAETMVEDQFWVIRRHARMLGFKLGAIFYDAIPVLRPELCNAETRQNHHSYMVGLAECDFVMPISGYSGECLRQFWKENEVPATRVEVNLLPGEFGGAHRSSGGPGPSHPVSILYVSTLEPRKNHRRLIEACLRLQEQRADLDWSLTLVGNHYAGALDIAEYVEQVAASNPRIRWLGIVDDDTLARLYSECSFTVYASSIEGFGMPIVESIWHGRPCLCANKGVMAELASEGGCITVDVEETGALTDALARLVEDSGLRCRLSVEAARRRLKSWRDYVRDFHRILAGASTAAPHPHPPVSVGDLPAGKPPGTQCPVSWTNLLYPGVCRDNWQMYHSERLALTALLSRARPTCAIEIRTYFGGSLSLISEYSELVYSVDPDPDVPKCVGPLLNVTYLTGRSQHLLPVLFEELSAAEIGVNFVLINTDVTAQGVRRDIESLLQYVPSEPLFVLIHNSFNPSCRRRMLEVPWHESPYCHFLDLDFVPGRLVKQACPAPNELWGGFAFAFLHPTPRSGPLSIQQSALSSFESACASFGERRE